MSEVTKWFLFFMLEIKILIVDVLDFEDVTKWVIFHARNIYIF